LWLACHTQEANGELCEVHKDTVSEICRKKAELPKSVKPAANHNDGIDEKTEKPKFEIPVYNVWKYKENSNKSKHFGNTN
jgi:hypothetical protein